MMEGLPFLAGGGVNLTGLQIVDITRMFSYFFRHDSTIKVIIFWLENGKFEFSRKQYIFLKHSKREFCAEFYYHF
jgi:hypothetical protein